MRSPVFVSQKTRYQGGITRNKRVKKNEDGEEKPKPKKKSVKKTPKKKGEKRERKTPVSSTRRKKISKRVVSDDDEDDDAPRVAPPPPSRPGRGKGPNFYALLRNSRAMINVSDEVDEDGDDEEDESSAPEPYLKGIGGKSFRRIEPVVEPVVEPVTKPVVVMEPVMKPVMIENANADNEQAEQIDNAVVGGNDDIMCDEYNQNKEELHKVDAVAAEMESDASDEEAMDEDEEECEECEEPPFTVSCDPSHCGIPLQVIPQDGVSVQIIPRCNICSECLSNQQVQVSVVDLSSRSDLNSSFYRTSTGGIVFRGMVNPNLHMPNFMSQVAEMKKYGIVGSENSDEEPEQVAVAE